MMMMKILIIYYVDDTIDYDSDNDNANSDDYYDHGIVLTK